MKKLFLAVCVVFCFGCFVTAKADVLTIEEAEQQASTPRPLVTTVEGMPDKNDLEAVRAFFKQRLKEVNVSDSSELGDLNKSNAMDIQHSADYIKALQEKKKSAFEKIYDEALKRLDKKDEGFSPDTIFYEEVKQNMQDVGGVLPDVPVVSVTLPNGKRVLAPAREHIPYLLTSYNILPTGLIEVDEEVVVISNGQKLKNGLVKVMEKSTRSRMGITKKLDVDLLSVSIDGKEVPYKLKEIGDNIVFAPKESYVLESGVYTYRFKYLLDRKLWYYKDFTEFYSDITSHYGLVITSANAIISVPDGKTFLSSASLSGVGSALSPERTVIARLNDNALGFASLLPMNAGEGMHLLVSLDKDVFISPDFGRRFAWFVTDWGDILFALLGFLAIFGSYHLSWKYLKENQSKSNARLRQNAALQRYVLDGVCDKRSFVAAILELMRLRVVDIIKENGEIALVKKSDKTKGLSWGQKKIMRALFGKNDTTIDVAEKNALKFKRAYLILQKNVKTLHTMTTLSINFGYLGFSLGMLLLSLYAISYIAINPLETGLILVSSVLVMMFYMWILIYPYRSKIKKYVFRTIGGIFIAFNVLLLSIYVHFWAACLIAAMSYAILVYTRLFSDKNGLIKGKIADLERLKRYLTDNAAQIATGIDFENRQATVFALGLEKLYPKNTRNQNVYRLDAAQKLIEKL